MSRPHLASWSTASEAGSSDWRHDSACLTEDPELFFPIGNTGPAVLQIEEAKAVCRRCPVTETCLRWAIDTGQDAGIWGGLAEDERRGLKRRTARALREAERRAAAPRVERADAGATFVVVDHHRKIGTTWDEIGRMLGATPTTCRDVHRRIRQTVSRTVEETARRLAEQLVAS